jgi:hypothetical protein
MRRVAATPGRGACSCRESELATLISDFIISVAVVYLNLDADDTDINSSFVMAILKTEYQFPGIKEVSYNDYPPFI